MCGGRLSVGFAHDTICVAAEGGIAHSHRVTFLNRAAVNDSFRYWCKDLDAPVVANGPRLTGALEPLAERVELRHEEGRRAARLVARVGGAEVNLREGEARADGPLAGWRLVYCNGRQALLRKGDQWSLLAPKRPPEPPRR